MSVQQPAAQQEEAQPRRSTEALQGSRCVDTLVLATHNRGKILELRALLASTNADPLEGQSLADILQVVDAVELGVEEPVEDQSTYEGNARIKAQAIVRVAGRAVLADDTGLEIQVLGSAPGVETKALYDAYGNWHHVHLELDRRMRVHGATTTTGREATLVCVLVLALADGQMLCVRGHCEGVIVAPLRLETARNDPAAAESEYGLADIFTPTQGASPMQAPLPHRVAAFEKLVPHLVALAQGLGARSKI